MNLIKQLMAGVMLLGSVASANAMAPIAGTEYNLGLLPTGYTSFGPHSVNDLFMDTIFFSVAGDRGSFGAGVLNFNVGGVPMMNISDLSMSLFSSDDTNLGSGLDFTVDPLAAGNYYLHITGNADGFSGGMYAGGISISAVPEPGVWKMVIAGMLIMGFTSLRLRDAK